MIDKEKLEDLSDEQLNYLIKQLMQEIKKLKKENEDKQRYINDLLMKIEQ